MYCPKCGTSSSDDQQFCRSCGLSLVMHAQLLSYQLLAGEPDKLLADGGKRAQHRRHRMLFRAFVTLIIIASLSLVIFGSHHFYLWVGSLGLLVTGLVGLTLCTEVPFLFYPLVFPTPQVGDRLPQPKTLPLAEPTAKLPSERLPEPLPSVTERTTGLL